MKKQYIKPDILFEDFALSTSIAAGCGIIIDNQAAEQCGYPWGKGFVFLIDVTGCTSKAEDGSEEYDGLCYDVPIATNELFNS